MNASSPAAFRAEDVRKSYEDVEALRGVSLDVPVGSCLALVGESGSGKTTLLRCFNVMVQHDSGRVMVHGVDVRSVDPVQLRRGVGYVQQDGGLLPHWTVLRNVSLVPRLNGVEGVEASATEALEAVGLAPTDFSDRWPRELSGGQRQRVALARAVAARPDVLLLDEPFGALDAITRVEVRRAFIRLRERTSVTSLLVTHDLREAFQLADEVAVMRAGEIEQTGTPRELVDSPDTEYVARLLAEAGVA